VGIRDRQGNQLTITRGLEAQNQRIQRITSPSGRWVEFTWTGDIATGFLVTELRDNIGRVVSYTYDTGNGVTAAPRLISVTDPAGGVTQYTYDVNQRMLTLRDARGILYLTHTYDAAGRVATQTQADNTAYLFAYTLDANGKIIQTDVTDPRGFVERTTFDARGYPLSETRAVGTPIAQTTTYQRDTTTSQVLSTTDALNRRTDYTHDATGNILTATRLAGTADAVTTTFTYEPTFNQVASVTDPLNHATTFGYDTKGNLTTISNPLNQQTTLTYNLAGQPLTITTPAGTTTLAYDLGDLVSVTDPTGKTTTRFTDPVGRLLSTTTPLGQRTRYEYDVLNRLTKITDPLGGLTQFSYDPNGNLLSVTDTRNSVTSYIYNNMDRLQTRTDPLLRSESYTSDNNGNLATFTDRKSQVTSRVYDALDRLSQVTYADQSTTTYTWDAGNRLTQIVDSLSGTITRSYDGLDRLTQEVTPQGTVSYTYDAAGRRTSMTVVGQPTVTYGYDNADRLTSITQGSSVVGFTYDNAGRRTTITLPNGVATEYAYDAASRITALTYKHGASTLGAITYSHDTNGNRRQVGGAWARTGLPQAVSSATYNAANHQLTFSNQTLTYDLNGNLITDGTNTYTWDARNQLAAISGSSSVSLAYDALGRRRQKTINGGTTTFLYDGLNPVQENAGGGVTNLLAGLGLDEFLLRSDAGGAYSLLADTLGSIIAITDSAGTVSTEYTYEPFGATTATGASTPSELQFTGRENDGTGLYYYRARYYHPTLQRFISEDPIGFAGGDLNLYEYVRSRPTNYADPLGLDPEAFEGNCTFDCDGPPPLGGRKDGFNDFASSSGSASELIIPFQAIGPGNLWQVCARFQQACQTILRSLEKAPKVIDRTVDRVRFALRSSHQLNQSLPSQQRELLREFFDTGKLPTGLQEKTLRVYREIAIRAVNSGKDVLGEQARRIGLIERTLGFK
jgi:RHS repeat-associated protein